MSEIKAIEINSQWYTSAFSFPENALAKEVCTIELRDTEQMKGPVMLGYKEQNEMM